MVRSDDPRKKASINFVLARAPETDILAEMKYFNKELMAAANDWVEQTAEERFNASREFEEAVKRYHRSLHQLKQRISGQAWSFFEGGHGRQGLHDGRLISLSVGDGLDYQADGSSAFRVNHQKTAASVVFLNYEQDLLYTFGLRRVNRICSDLSRCDASNWCLGDLFTYEIVAIDDDLLQLGFLFASGSSIVAQFARLVFRRRRIKRKYPAEERFS
jgi:hypothetical protein